MAYLKHNNNGKGAKPRQPKKSATPEQPSPSLQHDVNYVAGLTDIEASLDWIAKAIGRLTSDEHSVGLALSQNRYGKPVQLALCDSDGNDMTDRVVASLERIADAMGKLAGLNRPRLESWHEQDEYTPRYRDEVSHGGAPGPGPGRGEMSKASR